MQNMIRYIIVDTYRQNSENHRMSQKDNISATCGYIVMQ